MGFEIPAPGVLRVKELESFGNIFEDEGDQFALIKQVVGVIFSELRTADKAGNFQVIVINVFYGKLVGKFEALHCSLQMRLEFR